MCHWLWLYKIQHAGWRGGGHFLSKGQKRMSSKSGAGKKPTKKPQVKDGRRKLRKRAGQEASKAVLDKRTAAKAAIIAAGTYGIGKALNRKKAFDRLYSNLSGASHLFSQAYQQGYAAAIADLESGAAESGSQ